MGEKDEKIIKVVMASPQMSRTGKVITLSGCFLVLWFVLSGRRGWLGQDNHG